MVSSGDLCNNDSKLIVTDLSSLYYCNNSSLDVNISSTLNVLHACVDSPCISCKNFFTKSHDDMLSISYWHDENVSISSSCCANKVEEIHYSIEQDVALNDASRDPTSSSIVSQFFLKAKASKVSPTLNTNVSQDDDVDDNEDEDNDEESENIASLKLKGEIIFKALHQNNLARSNFMEILSITIEGKKYIELEAHLEEHETTIETMEGHEHDYANEITELSQALENEKTTKESLEETFALELSRLKESHDRALNKSKLGELQEEVEELRARLQSAQVALRAAWQGKAEAKAELASLEQQVREAADVVQPLRMRRALQFTDIAGQVTSLTHRFAGEAPALPNVRSDGGYLVFFQEVVEALEAGVLRVEEDSVSSARELMGLALTLVFSNLRFLAPELDLRCIVGPAPVESRHVLWGEVRPHVDALVGRYFQVPASSKEGGPDAGPVGAIGDANNHSPLCPKLMFACSCNSGSRTLPYGH
ncbi:hypothetical protein D1007_11549 [Hordeum vulgare]|nr:hypothetical protein D1007_11549 [Hordeum vulgare]